MYRALAPLQLWPPTILAMEWWEVGVLMGADIAAPPPRLFLPNEPRPDGPPPAGPRLSTVD